MVAKLRDPKCNIRVEKKDALHIIDGFDSLPMWPLVWCNSGAHCKKKRLRGVFNYECIIDVGVSK